MGKISRFILGGYIIKVGDEHVSEILNLLISNAIPFGRTKEKNESWHIYISVRGFKQYNEITNGERVCGEETEEVGFLYILKRYRFRFGMFTGALFFILSVALSSFFVWDINIDGNNKITEKEVIEYLDAYGFRLGAFIPRIDKTDICRRIMLENKDISFISINMKGTVANVEMHERESDEGKISTSEPSNLISKYDAQIERLEVVGGVAQVKYLQSVKKNDILVSGIIDSNAIGYRLVRARGKVFGRVSLVYESNIPLEYTEKIPTSEKTEKKSVKIFSKVFNLFKNNDIRYEKYDTIVNEERLYLFGSVKLPISVITEKHTEYEEITRTLSENEAYKLALKEIKEKSESELENAEILSRDTVMTNENGVLSLKVYVECILDIAEEIKIDT